MAKKRNGLNVPAPGSFKISYSEGFATLKVKPPAAGGKPVYPEQVLGRMKVLKIPAVRKSVIGDIIDRSSGEPERLVEWPDGIRLSAALEINISADKLTATAVMLPPKKGGGELSKEDIIESLRDRDVVFGVDEEAALRMIRGPIYGRAMVLAKGRRPSPGRSARARYFFNIQPKPYLTMDFDRINLKELNFIQNKRGGETLAVLTPAEPSEMGLNVLGEEIGVEVAGKDEVLKAGENAKLNREKDKIISLIDGNAFLRNGAVRVERVVTVDNVNYETGNIDFNGSVVVTGTIADGFAVKAEGSVQVAKFVGKASIEAGRDIVLRGGMNGNREGSLTSGGDLFARYLETAKVRCRGNLIVEEAIMHSQLAVSGNILLIGKRAELLSGSAVIGGSLWCKKLGNVVEMRTHVSLGIPPEKLEDYMSLQKVIENKIVEIDGIDSDLRRFDGQVQAGKIPIERALSERRKLEAKMYQLNADIDGLRGQARELRREMVPSPESMLIAEQQMHNGVVIVFGREEFEVPLKGLRKTILRVNKRGKILESGFNPLDRPRVKFQYNQSEYK